EEALLERAQELVLVAEPAVEAADRRPGACDHGRDRQPGETALGDQGLGGFEEAVERALAARLLGTANGRERDCCARGTGRHTVFTRVPEPESDSRSIGRPPRCPPRHGRRGPITGERTRKAGSLGPRS